MIYNFLKMVIDINYLVDKKSQFFKYIKEIEILDNLSIYQFFPYRYGIGKKITSDIIKIVGIHKNTKIEKYPLNIINRNIKYIFTKAENTLDNQLRRNMKITLKKYIDLYNYRGSRYLLKLPLNGQRRRANNKTVKKIRPIENE